MQTHNTLDIHLESKPSDTYRVSRIRNDYDYTQSTVTEHVKGILTTPEEWHIGLIVGSSGSGKSTIAKTLGLHTNLRPETRHASIIDDMPTTSSVQEITDVFTHLGFSSIPNWLKPYSALSTGEKMRADLAYTILSQDTDPAFDEYTSVVDREVAENISIALHKAILHTDKRITLISCHRDVIPWLQPDWIYDTDEQANIDPKTSSAPPKHTPSESAQEANGTNYPAIII